MSQNSWYRDCKSCILVLNFAHIHEWSDNCHVLREIHLLQLLMYISSSLTYNLTVILKPQYNISTTGEHRVLTFYSKMTQMILIRLKDMSSWHASYEANIDLFCNFLSFSGLLKHCLRISHSYLTGAIAAQLWWHLSNMNAIQQIQHILIAKASIFLMEILMYRIFNFFNHWLHMRFSTW